MAGVSSNTTEPIDNLQLFNQWRAAAGSQVNKSHAVAQFIINKFHIDSTLLPEVTKEVASMAFVKCAYFSKIWKQNHRIFSRVLIQHADFMNEVFSLPLNILNMLPSSSKAEVPSKRLMAFDQVADVTKRRRTAELRRNFGASQLSFAAQMSLRSSGKKDAAKVVKEATQTTPTRASKMRKRWSTSPAPLIPYSEVEALALIMDTDMSKSQYVRIQTDSKERNAKIYPPYYKVLEAKKECYPSDIRVTEGLAEATLQSLLDHTSRRILEANPKCIETLTGDERFDMKLSVKWGFDGSSDHHQYKQKFDSDDLTDSHIFLTSLVPIKLETTDGKVVFQNNVPSSTRYCRPLRIQFVKETKTVSTAEKSAVDNEIKSLKPFETDLNGQHVRIAFEMLLTMIDGKVCGAITSTASQTCCICGATPKFMNDFKNIQLRTLNEDAYQYCVSPLHAWIRFFEYFIHVSYRLDIKTWQVREEADKMIFEERKKKIQKLFKQELGLNVDQPRSSGAGSSNDGNTARRFFQESEKSSKITGIDLTVIQRCGAILQVLSSGREINASKFEAYCLQTAQELIKLYPWYYLPAAVHKILFHGSQIVAHFLIPIGQLSEEAQESRNKDIRNFREDHTRKSSRVLTNIDLFHRLLESSDPLVTSLRKWKPKPVQPFVTDAKYMLDLDDSEEESE